MGSDVCMGRQTKVERGGSLAKVGGLLKEGGAMWRPVGGQSCVEAGGGRGMERIGWVGGQ